MPRKPRSKSGDNTIKNRPKKARYETNYECLATVQFKGLDNRLRGCIEDINALTNDVRTIRTIVERWNRQTAVVELLGTTMSNEPSIPSPRLSDPHKSTDKVAISTSESPSNQMSSERSIVKRVCHPKMSMASNTREAAVHRSQSKTILEPMACSVRQPSPMASSNLPMEAGPASQLISLEAETDQTIADVAQVDRPRSEVPYERQAIPDVAREVAKRTGFPIVNNNLIIPVREGSEFSDTINAYRRMDALANPNELDDSETASDSNTPAQEPAQNQDEGFEESIPDPFTVYPAWLPTMPHVIRNIFGEDILQRLATSALCFGAWDQLVNLPTEISPQGRLASFFFLFALFTLRRYAELDWWATAFARAVQTPRVQQEMALLRLWVLAAVVAGGLTLLWNWWMSLLFLNIDRV